MKLLYWVWSAIIQTIIISTAVSAKPKSNKHVNVLVNPVAQRGVYMPVQPNHATFVQPNHATFVQPNHATFVQPNHATFVQPNRAKGSSVKPFTQRHQTIKKTILNANVRVLKATNDFIMAKKAIRDARKQALLAERSAVKAINEKVKVTKQQMLKATRNMIFAKKELAKAQKQAKKIKAMARAESIRKKAKLKRLKAIEAQKRYIAIQTAVAKHIKNINKARTKERIEAVQKAIAETRKATESKIKRITSYEKYKQNILRKKFELAKQRIERKARNDIRHIKLRATRELKKTRDACHAMMKRHGLLIKKQYQKIKKQIALIKTLRIKQHDLIKQKQDECLASLDDLNENETINDDEEQQIIKALELANKRAGCNSSKVCKTIDVNVCHCLDYGFDGITNCLAAISKLELENTIAVNLAKEIKSLDVLSKAILTKAPKQIITVSKKPIVKEPAPTRVVTKAPAPTRVVTNAPAPTRVVTEAPAPTRVVTEATAPKRVVTKAPAPTRVVTEATAPTRVVTKAPAPTRVVTKAPAPIIKAPARVVPKASAPTRVVTKAPAPIIKAPARVVPKASAPIVKAPAKTPVKMPFTFKTATASGDPHVDTFDGVHHDTMVAGWFSWVKNPVIHVQAYTQLGCMPANIPNTCIRAVVVQITPPHTNERLVVSWGSWPPERSVQNIVIQDSTGSSVNVAPNAYKAKTFLNGKYQIAKNGGTLSIRPVGAAVSNPELAVSVSISEYMLAVTLPNAPPHSGQTNGLMGFFNGDGTKNYAKVFRNLDGKASAITTKSLCQGGVGACGWGSQQKPEIINWAVTHVVTAANGINPPIAFTNKPNLVQQGYFDGWKVAKPGRKLLGFSDFSPVPIAMEPIVLPSYVPKVSKEEMAFCKKLLRGKVSKKKYMSQMKSCLQDASSPTVAQSIAKVNVVARKQQRCAKRALVKAVRKNKKNSIERLRILYKSIQNLMKLYEQ